MAYTESQVGRIVDRLVELERKLSAIGKAAEGVLFEYYEARIPGSGGARPEVFTVWDSPEGARYGSPEGAARAISALQAAL